MSLVMDRPELEALEELFGSEAEQAELEEEAGDELGFSDTFETPQAVIGTIVWTVRLRC